MYFANFPLVNYVKEDGQLETIQDILIRIDFKELEKTNAEVFIEYNAPEGSTPEFIAESVYGDQEYFWLVLLFNNFLDPNYSIPLRSRSLDDYTDRKYRSQTLFITPENDSEQFFSHPNPASNIPNFREGDTITVYLGQRLRYKDEDDDKVLGIIKRYIPELSAIQLDSLTGVIKEGDVIVRGYEGELRAKVSRVTISRYSVHHFEENGIQLNPMATPPDDKGNQIPIGQTGDGFLDPVGVTQTILENYMNDGNNTYVITNEDYEFKENEKSRKLKLVNPRLLNDILRQFREVIET